jgi:hypothetical protein
VDNWIYFAGLVDLWDWKIHIGDNAFTLNSIRELKLPEGVTYIGDSAFAVNRIEELEIPEGLTYIGGSAFAFNRIRVPEILNLQFDFHRR